MAEIAIPIVALAGMYLLSNNNNNSCKSKEAYENLKRPSSSRKNTNGSSCRNLFKISSLCTFNSKYGLLSSPNAATDLRYYQQKFMKNKLITEKILQII